MNYDRMNDVVKNIKVDIKGLYTSGSVKRKEDFINNIDFITLKDLDSLLIEFYKKFDVVRVLTQGENFICFEINIHIRLHNLDYEERDEIVQIDIYRAFNKYEYFYKKFMKDLDICHQNYYKNLAKEKGLRLSDLGLFKPVGNTEGMLYITDRKELKRILTQSHNLEEA